MDAVYERMASDYERDLRLLQSKYDQLEAAYQSLAESGRKLNQHINELQTDNAELRIENGSLRKDAGRYRWLRQLPTGMLNVNENFLVTLAVRSKNGFGHKSARGDELDAAIDAAMGEGK